MADEDRTGDHRTLSEHDTDRILYSDGLRRLGGVTQVVAVGEISLFHTRLTHTLKVAQISRRLAEHLEREHRQTARKPRDADAPASGATETTGATEGPDELDALGGLDPSVAEAAGLAHDLGHPPFGHVGEEALNECCEAAGLDGFEGNAQTFRVITKLLRAGDYDTPGLDLTPRTLNAVIKYPRLRPPGEEGAGYKWNAYPTEKQAFDVARATSPCPGQSLKAAIMDWADDITYAVHDVEDFVRAGRIRLDRLLNDSEEMEKFLRSAGAKIRERKPSFDIERAGPAFAEVAESFLSDATQYRGSIQDLAEMQESSRVLINRYVSAATLGTLEEPIAVAQSYKDEIALFKQLTWYYVIHNPALATMQEGQKVIVSELFKKLTAWLKDAIEAGEHYRLPLRLLDLWYLTESEDGRSAYPRAKRADARRARAVADYISSLTEAQVVDLYNRVSGRTGQSVLDPWMGY
ncbi:deoxyguanosinetriphosphate triphosphohydrolase family protein [Geodermatophilus nigrescens]